MYKALSLIFLFSGLVAQAQLRVSDAEIMVLNKHVWRGDKLGTSPAIEPSVTFSSGRFSLNLWAAATTNNSYSEIDIIPSWQFDHFQLTLFDYYNPVQGKKNRFLNFQDGENRHSIELAFDNFSVEKHRLKWMLGTFLFGDRHPETGNPQYSTYIECKYPFNLAGFETVPFIGITPFKGYYADGLALINSGISVGRSFETGSAFTIPVSLSFVSNPYTQNTFLIFAVGIAL